MFVADNIDTFEASDPKLPECAFNRLADNWRPLFAIAEILLADLKQKFTDDRIFSKDLVESLAQMKERLWPEVCRRKPITKRWVARQLHSFKILSSNIRIGAEHKVGFTLARKLSISKRQVKNQNDNGKTWFLQHLGTGELARAGHNSIRKRKPYYQWRV